MPSGQLVDERLYDGEGRSIDVLWLRDATVEEAVARLGEPQSRDLSQHGLEILARDWWLWGGAVNLRRADAVGFASPMVAMHAPHLHFSLDVALRLSGLRLEDAPAGPERTPEGVVTWPNWPAVGQVVLDYAVRELRIAPTLDPRGGGREISEAQVIDIARYRAVA